MMAKLSVIRCWTLKDERQQFLLGVLQQLLYGRAFSRATLLLLAGWVDIYLVLQLLPILSSQLSVRTTGVGVIVSIRLEYPRQCALRAGKDRVWVLPLLPRVNIRPKNFIRNFVVVDRRGIFLNFLYITLK